MRRADAGELLSRLASVVGERQLLTADDSDHAGQTALLAYEQDWRKRYRGRALAVVRPGSAEEVQAVVSHCAQAGVSLVPQGGNTGLVGGGVPDESGTQIVLNLQRLNRIRQIDAANLTITVEAGCILQQVQAAAAEEGLLFPLSLAAEGSCTIGGNLATNAGGTQVLRFGNARDLCLGLEVVTPQGQLLSGLGGLRKDNTGYSLRDLYIGSEGTLGIITAATLKLYPQPAATRTALATCPSLPAAVALLNLARRRLGSTLTGFEVMNALSRQLVANHLEGAAQPLWTDRSRPAPAWSVLIEQADEESESHAQQRLEQLLEEALHTGRIDDAAVAQSLEESRRFWHLREAIPLAQASEGLNIKHDIALPISRIPSFVESCDALLGQHLGGIRVVNFGHLGDGNLHYNAQAPQGMDAQRFLREQEAAVNRIVYDEVTRHGGSISAEHGIGQLKREELVERKDAVALQTMRAIKTALDPENLLNPGRLL